MTRNGRTIEICGKTSTPNALATEMMTAATNAPVTDPMPPITTTTNASPMMLRSIRRLTNSRGTWSAPPRPARNEPTMNAEVKRTRWLTPSAPTISRSCVAARTRMPQRVRWKSSQMSPKTTGPMTMRARSYSGIGSPKMRTARSSIGARGPRRSSEPQIVQHRVLHDEDDAERRDQLEELGRVVDPPQDGDLDDGADQRRGPGRQQDAGPEADDPRQRRHQRVGHVGAEHVQRAVREVHHARHAEDDRQARRDEEQRGRVREPRQELSEVEAHHLGGDAPWVGENGAGDAPPMVRHPAELKPDHGAAREMSSRRPRPPRASAAMRSNITLALR